MLFYSTTVFRFLTTVLPFLSRLPSISYRPHQEALIRIWPNVQDAAKVPDILILLEEYALDRVF